MQELEHQVQELTHQLGTGPHSVRVLELESECKLAEERIAELESQLATAAPMLDAPGNPSLPISPVFPLPSPPPFAPPLPPPAPFCPPLPCYGLGQREAWVNHELLSHT